MPRLWTLVGLLPIAFFLFRNKHKHKHKNQFISRTDTVTVCWQFCFWCLITNTVLGSLRPAARLLLVRFEVERWGWGCTMSVWGMEAGDMNCRTFPVLWKWSWEVLKAPKWGYCCVVSPWRRGRGKEKEDWEKPPLWHDTPVSGGWVEGCLKMKVKNEQRQHILWQGRTNWLSDSDETKQTEHRVSFFLFFFCFFSSFLALFFFSFFF